MKRRDKAKVRLRCGDSLARLAVPGVLKTRPEAVTWDETQQEGELLYRVSWVALLASLRRSLCVVGRLEVSRINL